MPGPAKSVRRQPATHTLVAFIDEHRDRFGGVEPICRTLTAHDCKIAPSTYYAHKKRLQTPSARSVRDEALKERIRDVFTSNYRVYGARKIWRELNRQGHAVARCTVERLMRELGIQGAVRGKRVITTIPGGQVQRAPDLVDRDFVAAAPNRCWVADFTHVKTVYVAFVVDTFSRRIVGWSAATVKETVFVLDALEMAIWQRDRDQQSVQPGELIHHSDAWAIHMVQARRAPGRRRHRGEHGLRRGLVRLSVSWHRVPQGSGSPGRDGLTLATTDPTVSWR
ncbi:IS3 family transposase [Streptomyces sp. NPDC048527]|uniref:IS3 family transposase n=1 Tax=Streptomyces sp. NPDC048527 TaxID=3365568 RepID=UPI003720E4CA